jgi:hypothetical protein
MFSRAVEHDHLTRRRSGGNAADMVVNRPAVEAGLSLLEAGGDLPTASLPKKESGSARRL